MTVNGRAGLYFAGAKTGFCWLLARYAEAVGDQQESLRWLSRAVEATEEVPGSYVQAGIGMEMVPVLAAGDRYEDAIQGGIQGARSMVALRAGGQRDFQALFQPGRNQSSEIAAMGEPEARQAEHFAAIGALVPVMLRLARRAILDRAGVFADGEKVASLCHQFAAVAHVPTIWSSAGDIFAQACREGASDKQLIDLGNGFDGQESPELRVLAYVGSAMHCDPFDAFCSQIASTPWLFRWFAKDSLTYRVILLPYLASISTVLSSVNKLTCGVRKTGWPNVCRRTRA